MMEHNFLRTVPGAAVPFGYGVMRGEDGFAAAKQSDTRSGPFRKVEDACEWIGPWRKNPAVAVSDAWVHATDSTLKTTEILCGGHGTHPWKGEVLCVEERGGCGRVFLLSDPSTPEACPCGEPMTEGGAIVPICPACFEERNSELDNDAN